MNSNPGTVKGSIASFPEDRRTARELFEKAWKGTGKKLSMGSFCFKTLEDAARDAIREVARRTPVKVRVEDYVKMFASAGWARM